MHIRDLNRKNICILGYGKEGRAMAKAIQTYAPEAIVTVADRNKDIEVEKAHGHQTGDDWLKDLSRFDVIIKSPGIPPQEEFKAVRDTMTSPTQIFFDTMKDTGVKTIGVTGSKGKSTTTSLLYKILSAAPLRGRGVFLMGNIGIPAISHIADAKPDTIFVIELSSYQLMDLKTSPNIAIVTSFFPEHLDYHGSLEAYLDAKKNITRWQEKNDVVFYPKIDAKAKEIASESKGKIIGFSSSNLPLTQEDLQLKGEHNRSNAAGALAVALELGVDKETALQTIRIFKGLPHRLETVAVTGGIVWVNDSISTTPESAVAALNTLGDRVVTIILGGQDRGYDFAILAKRMKASCVKTVILLPESGSVIEKTLQAVDANIVITYATDMPSAVTLAKKHTQKGIVLLSPASPSYGHFKNFEDRGMQFKECIQR
jgi:UDP-N-acetylmuramoylalanine--D-glutamate ligase